MTRTLQAVRAGAVLAVLAGCPGTGGGGGGKVEDTASTDGTGSVGAVQVVTVAGTTGRDGTWAIPVEIPEQGGVMQIDARADGALISTEFLYDPNDRELVSWEDWTGRYGLTDAFYVNDDVTVFNWPIRDSDPELKSGTYAVQIGTVDDNYRYVGAIDVDVTVFWRPDPGDRTLTVELLYAGGLEGDADIVAAVDAAVERWREIYGAVGISLEVRTGAIDMDAALPSLYTGSDELQTWYRQNVDDLAVPVIIGEQIDNDRWLYGEAGGIPGPLIASRRSAVVVSWLTCAGADGTFEDADVEMLAETMAHEVGHYLGAYHPVESNYRAWDALEDTPECAEAGECEDAMGTNLMFPYPICAQRACVEQVELTGEQAGVLSRFMGVK